MSEDAEWDKEYEDYKRDVARDNAILKGKVSIPKFEEKKIINDGKLKCLRCPCKPIPYDELDRGEKCPFCNFYYGDYITQQGIFSDEERTKK